MSSASSSGNRSGVDGDQIGNPGQSATLKGSDLNPSSSDAKVARKQVRHSVVQTDPPPKAPKPCNTIQKRRRRIDIKEEGESSRWFYHPFGKWLRWPFSRNHDRKDVYIAKSGPGFREAYCGPSMLEDWFRGGVTVELAVRSSVVSFVVASAPGFNEAHVVDAARSSVVSCSASMQVNPPSVGHTSRDVSTSGVDIHVRSCGRGGCTQIRTDHCIVLVMLCVAVLVHASIILRGAKQSRVVR